MKPALHKIKYHVHDFIICLLLIATLGCNGNDNASPPPEKSEPVAAGPLRVLVVDDEPLALAIQRQWQARSESQVKLQHVSADELDMTAGSLTADVVVYPAGLLGELVENDLISAVPDHVLRHANINRRDILALDRGPIVTWGKTVYAFSFGSPQFTLIYRSDLLAQLGQSPPKSWKEYQDLAARLNDRSALGDLSPPPDSPWNGTAEPLAAGWGGQILLARAAAYIRRRSRFSTLFNYRSMEPLIDQPPFVKALEELVASAHSGPDNSNQLSPHDVRRAILQGRCAMALGWPIHDAGATDSADSRQPSAISFAPLPGSTRAYSFSENEWEAKGDNEDETVPLLALAGRLGSVVKSSRRSRSGLSMLAALTGKELSGRVASRSDYTTMFRTSQLAEATDWVESAIDSEAARGYASVVEQSHESSLWLFAVRIPGRAQYLAALDDAVHQALRGTPSVEALKTAASRWRKITQSRTAEAQRNAYAKSLGLEP